MELGYPELRFHDLRHTFASIMVDINEGQSDMKTAKSLQEALGHYSVWFTYDTYASLFDEQKKSFAKSTQKAFDRAMDLPQNDAPKATD